MKYKIFVVAITAVVIIAQKQWETVNIFYAISQYYKFPIGFHAACRLVNYPLIEASSPILNVLKVDL